MCFETSRSDREGTTFPETQSRKEMDLVKDVEERTIEEKVQSLVYCEGVSSIKNWRV